MKTFTLRLPDNLAAALDVRAAQAGKSRQQFIVDLLAEEIAPSALVLGRWQVYSAEADTCADCGQALDLMNTWLGATADGRLFGPLCGECARGD